MPPRPLTCRHPSAVDHLKAELGIVPKRRRARSGAPRAERSSFRVRREGEVVREDRAVEIEALKSRKPVRDVVGEFEQLGHADVEVTVPMPQTPAPPSRVLTKDSWASDIPVEGLPDSDSDGDIFTTEISVEGLPDPKPDDPSSHPSLSPSDSVGASGSDPVSAPGIPLLEEPVGEMILLRLGGTDLTPRIKKKRPKKRKNRQASGTSPKR
jgi:hypothetical protein